MERSEDEVQDVVSHLQSSVEKWYEWLISKPTTLFGVEDVQTLQRPVVYFHKANEWLSRTTMLNAEWFFREGSEIVMDRWRKEEYDSYDS